MCYDPLCTALGEIAYSAEGKSDEACAALEKVGVSPEEMDDLFIRHTYLSAVIRMVMQASFGIVIQYAMSRYQHLLRLDHYLSQSTPR